MSLGEAAEYARVSKRTILAARADGSLVAYLPRGRKRGYRYLQEDIDKWLLGCAPVRRA